MSVVTVCENLSRNVAEQNTIVFDLNEQVRKAGGKMNEILAGYEGRIDNQARTIASLQDELEKTNKERKDYAQAFEDILSVMSLTEMARYVKRVAQLHEDREQQARGDEIPEQDVMEFIRVSVLSGA